MDGRLGVPPKTRARTRLVHRATRRARTAPRRRHRHESFSRQPPAVRLPRGLRCRLRHEPRGLTRPGRVDRNLGGVSAEARLAELVRAVGPRTLHARAVAHLPRRRRRALEGPRRSRAGRGPRRAHRSHGRHERRPLGRVQRHVFLADGEPDPPDPRRKHGRRLGDTTTARTWQRVDHREAVHARPARRARDFDRILQRQLPRSSGRRRACVAGRARDRARAERRRDRARLAAGAHDTEAPRGQCAKLRRAREPWTLHPPAAAHFSLWRYLAHARMGPRREPRSRNETGRPRRPQCAFE